MPSGEKTVSSSRGRRTWRLVGAWLRRRRTPWGPGSGGRSTRATGGRWRLASVVVLPDNDMSGEDHGRAARAAAGAILPERVVRRAASPAVGGAARRGRDGHWSAMATLDRVYLLKVIGSTRWRRGTAWILRIRGMGSPPSGPRSSTCRLSRLTSFRPGSGESTWRGVAAEARRRLRILPAMLGLSVLAALVRERVESAIVRAIRNLFEPLHRRAGSQAPGNSGASVE